jgi:isoquinoline 1-oxidoreductase subunit beta
MSVADVVLYPVSAGGSFDARLEHAIAIEVALLAREAGAPVQLTWSRWQEHVALPPRTPAAGMIGAEVAADGTIAQMRTRIACPPTAHEFGRRLFGNLTPWSAIDAVEGEGDPLAVEGMIGPYAIPDIAVQHIPVKLALPTARMRANAHGYTCFMRESFLDEVALRHEREPLSYRIAMLGQEPRLVAVLQRAARLAEWDGGARGTGQGLACHVMQLGAAVGRIALVATATPGAGGVRVSRLSACVDIGRVVNRDIALQQIESGLVFGLGLALGCSTSYSDGLPALARLSSLALPTLEECPEIQIDLVESDDPPFDPGEIGVPPVAPAIANALFSVTGVRLRRLPLLSDA